MTVGIAITNGLDAIVITDSRASGGGRQRDTANKLGYFQHAQYQGVVFGTGNADLIEAVLRNVDGFTQDSDSQNFEGFVGAIDVSNKKRVNDLNSGYFQAMVHEIDDKSKAITDPVERKAFVERETLSLIQGYDSTKRKWGNFAGFIVIGYDKAKNKIRMFSLSQMAPYEIFEPTGLLGSGSDGSDMYLSTSLQGVDVTHLKPHDLAFFALNAYATSNINYGVGGTPKIAVVSQDACRVLPVRQAVALTNLSGAHLSGFSPAALDNTKTREMAHRVLVGDTQVYQEIAWAVGLTEDALTTLYVPFSSWCERANRRMFGNGEPQ